MALCCSFFVVVGVITVTVFLFRFVKFLQVNFFTSVDLKRKYAAAGDWAVVTGATEGIGRAMALNLASRGFNICVVARTEARLRDVVDEAERKGVKGLAVVFDFATAGDEEYTRLFEKLSSLGVALLVNNVGINYTYPNFIDEVDLQEDLRLLKVNCEATLKMTRFIIPRMKEKRAGGIVFLSSFSALTPVPMLCTYAGSKAFNLSFGEALAYELRQFGIDVLVATPNLVVSKMTQGKASRQPKESFMMVGAPQMARQTLDKLGVVVKTSGHINHQLIKGLTSMLPESLVAGRIFALHKSIKRRTESKNK